RYLLFAIAACPVWFSHAVARQTGGDGLSPILTNNPVYQRQLWFWKQRAFPLPDIPDGARQRAVNTIQQIQSQAAPTRRGPPPPPGNLWVNIGPAPIFGEQQTPTSGD